MDTKDTKKEYLATLKISEVTKKNYLSALKGKLLCSYLEKEFQTKDIFTVTDLQALWKVYSIINLHPINVATHRNISCALMSYMRYLNHGERYGKRIDFAKSRKK